MNDIHPPINPDHPWAEASLHMDPRPIQALVNVEPVEIEQGDQTADAILMTLIDATGVKTVFIPPQMFVQLMIRGGEILEEIKSKHMTQGGLIVPSKQMEQEIKMRDDQARHLRSIKD